MTFSAQQIAALLGGKITGDANRQVWDVGSIESAKEGQLTFLCDAKYLSHLPQTGASVVLMTDSIIFDGETNATLIRVENARAAMGQLLSLVAKAMNPAKGRPRCGSVVSLLWAERFVQKQPPAIFALRYLQSRSLTRYPAVPRVDRGKHWYYTIFSMQMQALFCRFSSSFSSIPKKG